MTAATADMHAWLAALTLPPATAVQQRIPKKMLTEHAAATAADRKLVQERIDTVTWHASLKPGNVGVAAYEDALRCYLEIAVLTLQLRPAAEQRQALHSSPGSIRRLAELIHRAIPYPVVLLIEAGHELIVSMAHIRWAQRETGKTVLDGEPILASVTPPAEHNPMLGAYRQFLLALNLGKPFLTIQSSVSASVWPQIFQLILSPFHFSDKESIAMTFIRPKRCHTVFIFFSIWQLETF